MKNSPKEEPAATPKEKGRDFYDKVTALTPIITGGLITLLLGFLSQEVSRDYNNRQIEIARLNTITDLCKYIQNADPKQREYGYTMFSALGQQALAIHLITLSGDEAGREFLQRLILAPDRTVRSNAAIGLANLARATSKKLTGLYKEIMDQMEEDEPQQIWENTEEEALQPAITARTVVFNFVATYTETLAHLASGRSVDDLRVSLFSLSGSTKAMLREFSGQTSMNLDDIRRLQDHLAIETTTFFDASDEVEDLLESLISDKENLYAIFQGPLEAASIRIRTNSNIVRVMIEQLNRNYKAPEAGTIMESRRIALKTRIGVLLRQAGVERSLRIIRFARSRA
jgi:hypothetical protein